MLMTYYEKLAEFITQMKEEGASIGEPIPDGKGNWIYSIDAGKCSEEVLNQIRDWVDKNKDNGH